MSRPLVPPRSALARRVALLIAGLMVGAGLQATSVAAFDGAKAVTYADNHWDECWQSPYNGTPPSPYVCLSNDCTNYMSQAIHAGGYSFVNSTTDPNRRWYWYSTSAKTRSWYEVASLYFFLIYYDKSPTTGRGGGTLVETTKGSYSSDLYNSLAKGDLLFFDWEDDGILDHIRLEVGWGTPSRTGRQSAYNDSYWTTGDWADQHSEVRYHDFWNGYYQMLADPTRRANLRIYQVHIDPLNI